METLVDCLVPDICHVCSRINNEISCHTIHFQLPCNFTNMKLCFMYNMLQKVNLGIPNKFHISRQHPLADNQERQLHQNIWKTKLTKKKMKLINK
jgi:hypothetical protein